MSHKETGWTPKGASDTYNGYAVWDHGIAPHEVNVGEVDGDITFDLDLDFDEDLAEWDR